MCVLMQLVEMRLMADRNDGIADKATRELREVRKRVDELSSEVTKLGAQVC